jgi:hypothetical protein
MREGGGEVLARGSFRLEGGRHPDDDGAVILGYRFIRHEFSLPALSRLPGKIAAGTG